MLVPPAWVIEKANRRREQGDINQPSLWINEYPIPTKDDGFDQRNPAGRWDHVTWPIVNRRPKVGRRFTVSPAACEWIPNIETTQARDLNAERLSVRQRRANGHAGHITQAARRLDRRDPARAPAAPPMR